ncbi:MAG: protein kinase domain-containing protein, partial [Candidatus Thermochlorobacter sp.]
LFEQEARVLTQLNHPGIPKGNGYFTFIPKNSNEPLHCLVMEYISGQDLNEWLALRENQPIPESLAIEWLRQLVTILHQVHQQKFFHRDERLTR